MTQSTKRQTARHILELFAERPEALWATQWVCVIKGDKLTIVRSLSVMPTDPVIVKCVLEPAQSPSWLLVYWAVWKNWRTLVAANIKIS